MPKIQLLAIKVSGREWFDIPDPIFQTWKYDPDDYYFLVFDGWLFGFGRVGHIKHRGDLTNPQYNELWDGQQNGNFVTVENSELIHTTLSGKREGSSTILWRILRNTEISRKDIAEYRYVNNCIEESVPKWYTYCPEEPRANEILLPFIRKLCVSPNRETIVSALKSEFPEITLVRKKSLLFGMTEEIRYRGQKEELASLMSGIMMSQTWRADT